jgi:hypothetical protein
VSTPEPFSAVGFWYEEFSQTSDEEVKRLLDSTGSPDRGGSTATEPSEVVRAPAHQLSGDPSQDDAWFERHTAAAARRA